MVSPAYSPEHIVSSVCPLDCPDSCSLDVVVQDGRVTAISEKPTLSFDINAAVYAVEPRALAWVPEGRASGMPDLVETCLEKGEVVAAWHLSSDWIDVGTPTDLARAKGQA